MMSEQLTDDLDIKASTVGHYPLVVSLIDDLGVTSVLDELLPKDPRSKVSDADCVTAMVMNILGGRIALYRMEQWIRQFPVDDIIGPHCHPTDFTDDRLAKTLDNLHEVGTDTILSAVVKRYMSRENRVREYSIHQDTTSIVLYGMYEGDVPEWAPTPNYGYSKDHRPDLKQLVFGLTMHGPTGIPLVGTMFDGNTSDKYANNFHIEAMAGLLPSEDEITFVADSKLVDPQTLGALLEQEMHFISLIPRTFRAREEALELLSREEEDLPELGRTPGRKKEDPDTLYRGRSYDLPFKVQKANQEEEMIPLRFLPIHSEALEAKFNTSFPKTLKKDKDSIARALSQINKEPFSCEKDAQKALSKLLKKGRYHKIHASIERYEAPGKRPRGRPKKDAQEPAPQVFFRVILDSCEEDNDAIERHRRSKTHLVLLTSHLNRDTHSDTDILTEYRYQHRIEGHTGFRWLKGPGKVNPIFLKSTQRISGLGLIMMLALMVRNYVQFTIRRELKEREQTIPYYDRKRKTARPTAEVIWELFSDLVLITLTWPDGRIIHQLQGKSDAQVRILDMLGLDIGVLTNRKKTLSDSS